MVRLGNRSTYWSVSIVTYTVESVIPDSVTCLEHKKTETKHSRKEEIAGNANTTHRSAS